MFRRLLSTSSRLLNQSAGAGPSSVAIKRLPRLTLYTGGPECSLCEVAKQDLQVIRFTHPFELDTFNIHDPPTTVDAETASKIREDYKFDIPILHLDGHYIQKHRVNSTVLKQTLDRYDPDDPEPIYMDNKFRKDARPGTGKSKRAKNARKSPIMKTKVGVDKKGEQSEVVEV